MSKDNSFDFLHLVHVIKEPNTFKPSNNVRDHLKKVSQYFEQTKCPNNMKLQMFLKYLSLSVLEDLKLQLEYHDKVDLDWYEDKMLELYDDRRSLVTILVELVEIKQRSSETTIEFASRIKEKVGNKKIPINMQENIKVQLFINGLRKKNYSKALHILNPKSLIEALNMVRLDFNILETSDGDEDSSENQAGNYLDIIKSLCDKIPPATQINDPGKYNVDHLDSPMPEDHMVLFKDIMGKLQNPDNKGIIVFPNPNNGYHVLDIPSNDIMVGIPYENQSYEVISCKRDSGYVISDSLTKKHTVYKLPSDETLVLSNNGKIRFVKKPTLIAPSKFDKKMEITPLPQRLVDQNRSSEEIISMLELFNEKELIKRTNKNDISHETVIINPQADSNKTGEIIQNFQQGSKTIAPSPESKNGLQINLSNNLATFQLPSPVPVDNVSFHSPSVEYLSQFAETPLKEINNNPEIFDNNVIKANIGSIASSPNGNSIGVENVHPQDSTNISPNAKLIKSEEVITHNKNNDSKEGPVEKTIGRFKVISAPQN